MAARRAAAVFDPAPAARRDSGSGDHSVVGGSAWQRSCRAAVLPGGRRRLSGSSSSR